MGKSGEIGTVEFARMAGVDDDTIRAWERAGKIKPRRRLPVSNYLRFDKVEAEAFLRDGVWPEAAAESD